MEARIQQGGHNSLPVKFCHSACLLDTGFQPIVGNGLSSKGKAAHIHSHVVNRKLAFQELSDHLSHQNPHDRVDIQSLAASPVCFCAASGNFIVVFRRIDDLGKHQGWVRQVLDDRLPDSTLNQFWIRCITPYYLSAACAIAGIEPVNHLAVARILLHGIQDLQADCSFVHRPDQERRVPQVAGRDGLSQHLPGKGFSDIFDLQLFTER